MRRVMMKTMRYAARMAAGLRDMAVTCADLAGFGVVSVRYLLACP
jgi:hypothetical protein